MPPSSACIRHGRPAARAERARVPHARVHDRRLDLRDLDPAAHERVEPHHVRRPGPVERAADVVHRSRARETTRRCPARRAAPPTPAQAARRPARRPARPALEVERPEPQQRHEALRVLALADHVVEARQRLRHDLDALVLLGLERVVGEVGREVCVQPLVGEPRARRRTSSGAARSPPTCRSPRAARASRSPAARPR